MSGTYTAELPLGEHTVAHLAVLLTAERERRGTRKETRAHPLSAVRDGLRWFCDGTRVKQLAGDHGIGRSTAYTYLHEGIAVLALRVPDLRNALLAAKAAGYDHVIVDGSVIETDRVRTPVPPKTWISGGPGRSIIMAATSRSPPRPTTAGRCGCPASAPAASTTPPRCGPSANARMPF